MRTIWWGRFLVEREKGERDSRRLGIRLPFDSFSRLGLFLSLGLQRASFVVFVGVRFRQSGDQNGSHFGSFFLFGLSTQTQPFLLLIFFISYLVGEKVVEKSRNRRKDDQQPKICWFSLCLVNFLYFLFSLCFSRQPNKSYVILISCFTLFW